MSALSMLLCLTMLVGSTFAWFTDTVTAGKNKIVAGNLDVELEYWDETANNNAGDWAKVTKDTSLFDENTLWEPGHTEVVYLKVSNLGTLALKYKFSVDVNSQVEGESVLKDTDGNPLKIVLSEHLKFGQVVTAGKKDGALVEFNEFNSRDEAIKAVKDTAGKLQKYAVERPLAAAEDENDESYDYVALVVYMPEDVGNEANYRGEKIPSIDLGITLVATQAEAEFDSFDEHYDANATYVNEVEKFTFTNASDAIAFCPECHQAGSTADHSEHDVYLVVKDGVAEVPRNAAHRDFTGLDWDKNTYVMSYDVDLTKLDNDAFIAFDAGERTTWNDMQIGFKRDDKGISVYNTLDAAKTNEATFIGTIGDKVHITYTYAVSGASMKMTAAVSDGINTRKVERTVPDFTSADLYWNVYTAVGDADTYATLDNVVFGSKSNIVKVDSADTLRQSLFNGDAKIVLTQDIVVSSEALTISEGQTVEIDLGGHTISTLPESTDNFILIHNKGGNLTLKNGIVINGDITNAGYDASAPNRNAALESYGGILNVENCNISNTPGANGAYAVKLADSNSGVGCKATFTNCNISSTRGALNPHGHSTVVFNGGSLSAGVFYPLFITSFANAEFNDVDIIKQTVGNKNAMLFINGSNTRNIFTNCKFINNRTDGNMQLAISGNGGGEFAFTNCTFGENIVKNIEGIE